MTAEEKIKDDLTAKFDYLRESITIKRERRMSVDVVRERLEEVFEYLVKNMQFSMLSGITGLDEGQDLGVIYHLSNDGAIMLNLKTHLTKEDPSINTVTSYFPAADIYERELGDLLGIRVAGLAAGHRYPLADDWPKDAFPLRKDWRKNA